MTGPYGAHDDVRARSHACRRVDVLAGGVKLTHVGWDGGTGAVVRAAGLWLFIVAIVRRRR
jgi:hypothetical protein